MQRVRKPSNGVAYLVAGAVLLMIGLVGVARWIFVAMQPAAGDAATASGVMQALTDIGSALCVGIGIVMLVLGLIKRRRGVNAGSDAQPTPLE